MKTIASTLLLATVAFGANAYAADSYVEPNNTPYQGVYGQVDANAPTRAQVAQQIVRTFVGENDNDTSISTASSVSREQVLSELQSSRARGGNALFSVYPEA